MSLPMKICLVCGAEFTPYTCYQKHCGKKECRQELDRRKYQARKRGRRLCFICGICFMPKDDKEVVCSDPKCQETHKKVLQNRPGKKKPYDYRFEKPISDGKRVTGKELAERQGIWVSGMTFEEQADAARAAGMSYGKWKALKQMEYEKQLREKQN